MDDELHRPLGLDRDRDGPPWSSRLRPRHVALAIIALAATGVAALFFLAPQGPLDATLGGRPYALTKVEPLAPAHPTAASSEMPRAQDTASGLSVQRRSVEDPAQAAKTVDVQHGVRVVRAGAANGANPLIIEVDPASKPPASAR